MHTYVVTLQGLTSIPFDRLQQLRDTLEERGYGTPDWFTSSAMRWLINCDDDSFESEIAEILVECDIPTWYISIANEGSLQ